MMARILWRIAMPIDDSEKSRTFFNDKLPGGIDITVFRKFLEQYGTDFVSGYLTAIRDYQPQVRNIVIRTINGEKFFLPSQAKMKDEGIRISDRMELLLHFASAFLSEQKNNDANISPPTPL